MLALGAILTCVGSLTREWRLKTVHQVVETYSHLTGFLLGRMSFWLVLYSLMGLAYLAWFTGWEGWGVYVGLLCLLVNQPDGSLDVSDGDAWAVLALQMGCSEPLLETIVPYLAERGLADASALGDGRLQMPESDRALESFDKVVRAGKASGAARRRKAAEGGE